MTIILFLVDTSASMSQRTYLGARPTLLDVAKDAIEKFLKLRQRDPASRGDRYMLLTFEEPPSNIKAGWKEHHNVFMNELKNLTATGMTSLGASLKHSFDLLNLNRMQTGIDTYGQGRSPFFLEPSIIIVITDGGRLSSTTGVQEDLTLPMHSNVPGSELTKEPFRWDQRLFALVLRLTGMVPSDNCNNNINGGAGVITSDSSPIDDMCDVTGGCSYSVSSQRSLMQCLENVVSRIQGGVVIHFEKIAGTPDPITGEVSEDNSKENVNGNNEGSNDSNSGGGGGGFGDKSHWTSCRRLIYVQRSAMKGYALGHWPIPESFWPDINMPTLPPRSAHPVVKFSCQDTLPMVIENLPFDKYELEPSSLTKMILSRKQPNTAWQCFISNSSKSGDLGFPFGYLKASSNMQCVNLFVLPYNYPVLLPLLDDLLKVHQLKPTREWKMAWEAYLKTLPQYYASHLKKALQRMGAPTTLVPDSLENYLSFPILNHLKRLKNQAKAEFDKLVSSVGSYAAKAATSQTEVIRVNTTPSTSSLSMPSSSTSNQKKVCDMALVGNTSHPRISSIQKELNEYPNFLLRIKDKSADLKIQSYRNPYDISRRDLIDQIHRMRLNFFLPPSNIKYQDDDQMHSLPVAQMGNYQEYLKRMPTPLRELEPTAVRQHMFGNPFKIDKKGVAMVDETDIDLVGSGGSPMNPRSGLPNKRSSEREASGRPKRRPGPLPKDFVMRPPSPSLTSSTPSSPAPSSPAPSSPAMSPSPVPSVSSSITSEEEDEVMEVDESPCLVLDTDLSMTDEPEVIAISSASSKVAVVPTISVEETSSIMSLTPVTSDDDADVLVTIEAAPPKTSSHSFQALRRPNASGMKPTPPSATSNIEMSNMFAGGLGGQEVVSFVPDQESKFQVNGKNQPSYNTVSRQSSLTTSSPSLTPTVNGLTGLISLANECINNKFVINGSKARLILNREENELRRELFKLVKKPGKNYTELLTRLENLTPHKLKDFLIHEVINEAKRFKRIKLAEMLQLKFLANNLNNDKTNNFINMRPTPPSSATSSRHSSVSSDRPSSPPV